MSAITPPSFVDDAASLSERLPPRLTTKNLAQWISYCESDASSAYTGSFFDDGVNMLGRCDGGTRGFAAVDEWVDDEAKRREEDKAKRLSRDKKGWNEDVKRAVGGDMQRNLNRIGELRGVRVKKARLESGEDEKFGRGNRKEGHKGEEEAKVIVPVPMQWGTFVIKCKDGRVIIVDEDGEFDSGPLGVDNEEHRQQPWVRAKSTAEPSLASGKDKGEGNLSKGRTERGRRTKKVGSKSTASLPRKTLAPVLESEYENGYSFSANAGGWPSHTATPAMSPAVSISDGYGYIVPEPLTKPIREGYRHVKSGSFEFNDIASETQVKSEVASPVRTLPGSWPSPEPSPVKSWGEKESEVSWTPGNIEGAWEMKSSVPSCKGQKTKKVRDNVSVKSHATYKEPTVEDARSSSPEEDNKNTGRGWGGSVHNSQTSKKVTRHSSNGSNDSHHSDWASPAKLPHPFTWATSRSNSQDRWSSRPKAADNPAWTGIEPFSSQQDALNAPSAPSDNGARPPSEATWDGFERHKTLSDVSMAGSGSVRGSLHSSSRVSSQQASSAHSESKCPADRHLTASSRRRGRSKKEVSVENYHGWEHGSSGTNTARRANSLNEENATYLNDNWGGTPVRGAKF